MGTDDDTLFIILDKLIDIFEYLYNYYNVQKENEINIELGNLYTINECDEEEEEEVDFANDFILV